MKRFIILILSLLITAPCFAHNCGDYLGDKNQEWTKAFVDREYKEFVYCRASRHMVDKKFGDSINESLTYMRYEMELKKNLYTIQEYNQKMDFILLLKVMNLLGSIPNNLEDNYSIMLSLDGMDMDEIEEEYSNLLEETRIVKDKQKYKQAVSETAEDLMESYSSEYRVVDLTANYIKIMNTSNKSGMKGQLTDLYNQVIKYNKGRSYAKYK